METTRVRHFITVAKTGSVRKAAEILHITPGGLSKSLATFEDELSLGALFRRDGRSLILTDVGKSVEERSESFLKAFDEFVKPKEIKNDNSIRISTFEVFSTYFMSDFISSTDNRPQHGLVCQERLPGQIELDVLSRSSDLGLTYEPIPMRGIEFKRICKIQMGLFGRMKLVEGKQFLEWPFAAPLISLQQTPTGVKGLDGWPDSEQPRRIDFNVDMLETALGLARTGVAVVHIPTFIAKIHNQYFKKPFELEELSSPRKPITREAYLVLRSGESETRATKALTQFLRRLSRG